MSDRTARAESYRTKAEEVRLIAESMKDKAAQRMLMTVAQDYLAMADMLDRTAEHRGKPGMPNVPDTKP